MDKTVISTTGTVTPLYKQKQSNIIRNIVLAGIVFGVILPMIPQILWSISFRWYFPSLMPTELSSRAWAYVANPNSKILKAFFTSLIIALSVTAVGIIVGVPAGKALGMYRFKGKGLVELIILAPTIVPGLAVIMGIQILFIRMGLSDNILGVIIVHLLPTLPYMIISMAGVFANYDPQFEEQARSLGANTIKTFFYITLPVVFPGIVIGAMFTFLISWSQYILTIMVGGGRIITLPVLLFSFAGSGDNAITSALSIIFVLPAIIILVLTSKFLSGKSSGMGGFGNI